MTKDDILRMAREAGLVLILEEHASEYGNGTFEHTPYPEIERFANLVYAAAAGMEREEILKMGRNQWYKTQADFEKAIEARWRND
jgi:hypothetical protein